MPIPEEVHVDTVLTNLSVAYRNEEYVADRILPMVRVQRESDKYFVYGKEAFKPVDTLRADGAESNSADFSLTQETYSCDEHAVHGSITDRMRKNAEKAIDLEVDMTEFLTDLILLDYEVRAAALLTDSASYAPNHAQALGTSGAGYTIQWSDYTNSKPIQLIDSVAKVKIQQDCGRVPNTMLIPFNIAQVLAQHPDVLELTKYTDPTLLTRSGLPKVFRGLNVLEATATKLADTSMENIWGKNVIIAYVDPKPGLRKFSLGFTFVSPQGAAIREVRRWRDERIRGEYIEVSMIDCVKIVSKEAGFLISNVIA